MTSRAETPLPDLVANRSDAAAVSRDGDYDGLPFGVLP